MIKKIYYKLIEIWVNIIASFVFSGITVLISKLTSDANIFSGLSIGILVFFLTLFVGIAVSKKMTSWPEEQDRLGNSYIRVAQDHYSARSVEPQNSLVFEHEDETQDGRQQTFVLGNVSTHGIIVIKRISLVVERCLRIYKRIEYSIGGFMPTHYYDITLEPSQIKEYEISVNEFKYTSGEIDRFVINLYSSKQGYKYLFRLKIDWYDIRDMKIRTKISNGLVAYFYTVVQPKFDVAPTELKSDVSEE
jgi:hypothetical protein